MYEINGTRLYVQLCILVTNMKMLAGFYPLTIVNFYYLANPGLGRTLVSVLKVSVKFPV